ncbi:MAG: hypothetical protein ACYCYM_10770 [Saccharofermentanales bacterium]
MKSQNLQKQHKQTQQKILNYDIPFDDSDEKDEASVKARNLRQDKIKARILETLHSRSRLIIAAIPVALIVLLIVSIATQLVVQTAVDIQKQRYLLHAQMLSDDLNLRLDAVNDDYVTARLMQILSQDDLYVYTSAFWRYTITVNGVPVSNASVIIEKSSGTAFVALTETRRESVLPDAIIDIGSATRGDRGDSIGNHIKVIGTVAPMTVTTAGLTNTYAFTISGMKPGESFTIVLSDQLGARLGMPFTEIQVTAAGG